MKKINKIVMWIGLQNNLSTHVIYNMLMYTIDYRKKHILLMNKIFKEMLQASLYDLIFSNWDNGQYANLLNIGLDLNEVTPKMFRDYIGEEGYKYVWRENILYETLDWHSDMHIGLNDWFIKYNIHEGFQEWIDVRMTILIHIMIHREMHIDYHLHKSLPSQKKLHQHYCGCNLFFTN